MPHHVRYGTGHHCVAHIHLLQLPDGTGDNGVCVDKKQPLHVVGHNLVHERLDAGSHTVLPCGIVGVLALHLAGHGTAVEVCDALAVAGGNAVQFCAVGWRDAVVYKKNLLRLIARVVFQKAQKRDSGFPGKEAVDGITDV